jgi:pyruvate/2-oxoglutarate dehydrogenase complex dihydrolipoamide dehydrogenase (E3) component
VSSNEFDTVVVGGGSAGYAAARTLVAGGHRIAVLDGGAEVGGLCILRGCMPTKALLHAAELRHAIAAGRTWGITAGPVTVDLERLMARKDELIRDFAGYRRQQLEQGKWEFLRAKARFISPHELELDTGRRLQTRHVVLATGSELVPPPVPGLEAIGYLTSDSALQLRQLPASIIVLGGGAVALEFAQFFARLGTRVTVVQRGSQLLRECDLDVAQELEGALMDEGLSVLTGATLKRAEAVGSLKRLWIEHHGTEQALEAEEIFHGLGRRAAVSTLGLEAAGVALNRSGKIQIDLQQRTTASHIFAAGDCCGPKDIVHLAIQQGEIAAKNILGQSVSRDDRLTMSVVFTDPAVAVVGHTERSAKEAGLEVRVAAYPFNDHGKSMIMGCRRGFVKLLAERSGGAIVGGACVGPQAGELIHEIVVAMDRRMTAAQLAAVPHYHPTLAEIWTYPAEELAEG